MSPLNACFFVNAEDDYGQRLNGVFDKLAIVLWGFSWGCRGEKFYEYVGAKMIAFLISA